MFSSEKGMGLIGVMIGAGVSLIIVLAMSNVMSNINRQNKLITSKLELMEMAREIQVVYSNTKKCTESFKGISINLRDDLVGKQKTQYPNGFQEVKLFGKPLKEYTYGGIRIKYLGLEVIERTSKYNVEAWLVATPQTAGGQDLSLRPIKIPFYMAVDAGVIKECSVVGLNAAIVNTAKKEDEGYYPTECPSGKREVNRMWAPKTCVDHQCQGPQCGCVTPLTWGMEPPFCNYKPKATGPTKKCVAEQVMIRKCI